MKQINQDDWTLEEFVDGAHEYSRSAPVDPKDITWRGWHVSSPEGYGSVEGVAVGELPDGRWIVLDAWADTTGWGCQDDAVWTLHDSREAAVRDGLTNERRRLLGVEYVTEGGAA